VCVRAFAKACMVARLTLGGAGGGLRAKKGHDTQGCQNRDFSSDPKWITILQNLKRQLKSKDSTQKGSQNQ
jgi:hypothetical protein